MQKAVHIQRSAGSQLKKVFTISVFIFLFGLFSGLFFSTGISEENSRELSSIFISSITDDSVGFFRILISALLSNYTLAVLMLAAVLSGILSFLPFAVLWYKNFAIGFCCGLIHLSEVENPISLTLTHLLPPAIFLIPAFITLATSSYICSKDQIFKSKRPSRERKVPVNMILISLLLIAAGCIAEAICHI